MQETTYMLSYVIFHHCTGTATVQYELIASIVKDQALHLIARTLSRTGPTSQS
jgi:hypothetical protein